MRSNCAIVRRKFYNDKKRIRKLKKQINSLKDVIKDVTVQKSLSSQAFEQLETYISGIPFALMKRMLTQAKFGIKTTQKYPEELRKFAFTLNFYSPKAYDYVRQTFLFSLPHPSNLRKWSSSVECNPGFSTLCFDVLLKQKVEIGKAKNQKIICTLTLDEMSIKKKIEYDGSRNWGYVNVGVDLKNDDSEIATEALVIMVVAVNSSWKLPIGYFLINHLTGTEKANLVIEALTRLHDIGVYITSVTCDGPNAHFTMFNKLGCNLKEPSNMVTGFDHPMQEQKVYAIFRHMSYIKIGKKLFR